MSNGNQKSQKEIALELRAEIEKTLEDYHSVLELRRKTMQQDIEQVAIYADIIEKQPDTPLNPLLARRLSRLLSKKPKKSSPESSCREQQDELEKRFLELQDALVALISKRFKYR